MIEDRSLQANFDNVVHMLLLLFSQPSPQTRARVVRSLGALIQADNSLLAVQQIRGSVIERFNDVSISVREETVKLVGAYVVQRNHHVGGSGTQGGKGASEMLNPSSTSDVAVLDGYLSGLLVRLRDKGVSVRKSVVLILRDVLLHQPSHPR